ncbi:MAG: tRNA (adenosine(37)-N6)-threonylcarbamoyltransferase complex dimerization subunit type 1 TsaB, partial [Bdellovibrionaceae bacterium]|nr:tRNA (adenosine(37)-N6)-threonylcarbamoyltransferase complex dimerization subunit type 1 TsaB [Bdellovibrio sp.]
MIILASETSTLLGSVALFENGAQLAYKESPRQGSHSDVINVFIEDVLKKSEKKLSDIDLFAAGIGPGSFTGIRISVNAIKTLAYCYNKPIVGINSLINLAWQCPSVENAPIISMINAYKNMLYIATYKKVGGEIKVVREPEVIR